MPDKIQNAVDQVFRLIDKLYEPSNMSKREALDFLDMISTDLESRIDALEEELGKAD